MIDPPNDIKDERQRMLWGVFVREYESFLIDPTEERGRERVSNPGTKEGFIKVAQRFLWVLREQKAI